MRQRPTNNAHFDFNKLGSETSPLTAIMKVISSFCALGETWLRRIKLVEKFSGRASAQELNAELTA